MLPLARSEISQFDKISLHEYIFGLDISVENAFPVHELDRSQHLKHVKLDFLECKRSLLVLETLVHVHVHQLEDEGEFTCFTKGIPLGSSYNASTILIMFSCGERMLSA